MFCKDTRCTAPSRPAAAVQVSFQAIDTDGYPICGAVYRLCCACGRYLNAVTNQNGCVTFQGVCPGTYQIQQLAAAYGYLPDGAPHEVMVSPCGCVKIDGLPMRCFQSVNPKEPPTPPVQAAAPTLNPVTTATLTVSGTGTPGCKIELTFPGGCVCCADVHRDGTWSIDVPDDSALPAGETLRAVQLCSCQLPSETVCAEVTAA